MNRRIQCANPTGCGCGCGQNQNNTTETALCAATETTSTVETTQNYGCGCADETASSAKFCIENCCDFVRKNIGTITMGGVGQVINGTVTLCNVCPNRTIALGVTLAEVDECDCETNIAFKSFEITTPRCGNQNLKVTDLTFVVPKTGTNQKRCFRLHATANYLDTGVCF